MSNKYTQYLLSISKGFIVCALGGLWGILLISCHFLDTESQGREEENSTKEAKLLVHPLEADTLMLLAQEGDLVFRTGLSIVSRLVTTSDKESIYSHIGLVTLLDSVPMIIHAVPGEPVTDDGIDRVKIEPLSWFLSKSRASHALLMHSNVCNDTLTAVINEAKQKVNRHILFDHEFKLDTDDKLYCTELIYKVFMSQGIDLTQGRRSHYAIPILGGTYLFPSDIEKNERLTAIYSY